MESEQPSEAVKMLQRVVDKGEPKALRSIASLRLARLYLDQDDHAAAEALLVPLLDGAYGGLASAVHGDLLVAKGDLAAARQAYEDALGKPNSGDRSMLQMKLDELPAGAEKS